MYSYISFKIVQICINMKFANLLGLTSNRKVCSLYIYSLELKVLKLKEGICNTRLVQKLEYVAIVR